MIILVTGINGFVGKHLARELSKRSHRIIGVGMNDAIDPSLTDIVSVYHNCDLTNRQQVDKLPLDEVDGIVSLAGLAQVGRSFKNPELTQKINVEVLSFIGQRLVDEKNKAKIIAVSTGAVYDSRQPLPLTEASALVKEGSPYALSKIAMEQRAAELKKAGLNCVIVRPFNHIGPGQEPGFLVPDLYSKIVSTKNGSISVGNLKTRRDYTDVRDVVKAYCDLLENELQFDIYNICSRRSISGQEILDRLLKLTDSEATKVEVDQTLIRPDDPADLYGNNQRLRDDTGWQPEIDLETTLKDFVDSSKN